MSASRLAMAILCMTMSTILRSSDCHLSLAALLKLWPAPFFWNFFLGGQRQRGGGRTTLSPCSRQSRGPWHLPPPGAPGRLTWQGGRQTRWAWGGCPRSG